MPYIAKILIYPIKSLDGVEVDQATILSSGALQHDREFAIFDQSSRFVNGKRNPKVHLLRTQFLLEDRIVFLHSQNQEKNQEKLVFNLDKQQKELAATLSRLLGLAVSLENNFIMGFPDDTDSPGPTVISTATLKEVASWFPGLSVDEMRRRIRANIEIDGVPAFWEDQLFTEGDDTVSFRMGNVRFFGVNPCQRCVVPTRDSFSGEAYANFQKTFVSKRRETLPEWVATSRFNHFFKLSVNTRLPASSAGKILQIGDEVEILEH